MPRPHKIIILKKRKICREGGLLDLTLKPKENTKTKQKMEKRN